MLALSASNPCNEKEHDNLLASKPGYQIFQLEQKEFVINTDNNGLMKGMEVDHSTTITNMISNDINHHHLENVKVVKEYSRPITTNGESSLVVMIKTPQYWVFEIDERVTQISCGDSVVLVGKSRRTLYIWKYISDGCVLYKLVFDEEVDVVGFRRFLLVRTSSGAVYMSDSTSEIPNDLKKITTLPFDTKEEKIVDVSCGSTHNLMLTDKGKVYGYGQNCKWFTNYWII